MIQEKLDSLIDSLTGITEDYSPNMEIKSPLMMEDEVVDEKEKSINTIIREAIKPQVDIVNSVLQTIATAYADNCGNTKHMEDMEKNIVSWEKQLKEACDQIVAIVESKDGPINDLKSITKNNMKCSPRAFHEYIVDNRNRDYSSLNLAAAILVFYNSLG